MRSVDQTFFVEVNITASSRILKPVDTFELSCESVFSLKKGYHPSMPLIQFGQELLKILYLYLP